MLDARPASGGIRVEVADLERDTWRLVHAQSRRSIEPSHASVAGFAAGSSGGWQLSQPQLGVDLFGTCSRASLEDDEFDDELTVIRRVRVPSSSSHSSRWSCDVSAMPPTR